MDTFTFLNMSVIGIQTIIVVNIKKCTHILPNVYVRLLFEIEKLQ